MLRDIFNDHQDLESVSICDAMDEEEILRMVTKYSPKNFHRLNMWKFERSELLPETLESFFISWGNRTPRKSLILIVTYEGGDFFAKENLMVIEKYKRLGIVKEFNIESYAAEKFLFDLN
jgi:hypothetical protein